MKSVNVLNSFKNMIVLTLLWNAVGISNLKNVKIFLVQKYYFPAFAYNNHRDVIGLMVNVKTLPIARAF